MKICVIGLGYVGLPLALEFAKKYPVIGFDIKNQRIDQLKKGIDNTLEIEMKDSQHLVMHNWEASSQQGIYFTHNPQYMALANVYIVTVPTPIDKNNKPDLSPLKSACESIAKVLKPKDLVIFESTVFPGATDEVCIPILEKQSRLQLNTDFFVGYSPERTNVGDKNHQFHNTIKITSGSNPQAAQMVDDLYQSVLENGTYLAPSIQVAEAAKIIENAQRDINIAFVNELSKIFNLLKIDTHEVLKAASTKWNFINFKPGLVGGHCIGVDPYYLAHKAMEVGYHPEIILAGRRLNDGMGEYVAAQLVKLMSQQQLELQTAKVLVLGLSFKENCTDVRNSKAFDIIKSLQEYNIKVQAYDPWVDAQEVQIAYNFKVEAQIPQQAYDAIVVAVQHQEFELLDLASYSHESTVIYDVKGFLPNYTKRL
jgi:UDP-N-acetyl-D-glucosamine/UDP-N-acetyl-D-galactosamine dehydrogenase